MFSHLSYRAAIVLVLAPVTGSADTYRVFDWQGRGAPTEPNGPGAVTQTTYLNGGQYWDGSALVPMDVEVDVTVLTYDDPVKWQVDPEGTISGGVAADYGYQAPDEAEFNFGDPGGQVIMRFDFLFGRPVNNPSFFLMDIDNSGSDHGTEFFAEAEDGSIFYPALGLVAGSTVQWSGTGPTLDVLSGGGALMDNSPQGTAFFEWSQNDITRISFVWESNVGTSIRVSNVYAEYDPAGFTPVPEPGGILLLLTGLVLLLRRRRSVRRCGTA